MNSIFYLLIIFLLVSNAQSQPNRDWYQFYGDERTGLRDIYVCENGDYISVGGSHNINSASQLIYVLRIDNSGRRRWENSYDLFEDCNREHAATVIEADNGDFIVGGGAWIPNEQGWFACARISADGEVIWARKYGVQGYCFAAIETKAGEFLLGGRAEDYQVLYLIDADGEIVWEQHFRTDRGGDLFERITSIRETSDGGEFLCAGTYRGDASLLKISADGDVRWRRIYTYDDRTLILPELVSVGNRYYLGGNSRSENGRQMALLLLDREGRIVWDRFYQFRNPASCLSLAKTQDDGAILTGQIANGGNYCGFAFKVDHSGDSSWFHLADRVLLLGNVVIDRSNFPIACGAVYEPAYIYKLQPDISGPIIVWTSPPEGNITILQNDSIQFKVRAIDFQNDVLRYYWTMGDDTVSRHPNSDSTHSVIDFNSGDIFDLKCLVSDATGADSSIWHVTVTDLYVSAFTPDTLALAIRRGESVDFSLDTVRAVEGDPVDYLWLKRNVDIVDEIDTAGRESRATVPFLQSGHYRVDGVAYRGESSDVVSWDVAVRGAIWAFAPEDLAFEVLPDSMVSFIVEPTAPDAEGQTIRWLIDGELASEDTTLFNLSFGEADSCPPHLVQVVVADTVESDTVTWAVTVVDPDFVDGKRDAYPTRAELLTVSPNPFNSTLTITFPKGIPPSIEGGRGGWSLCIFDISGRVVADLSNSAFRNPHSAFGYVIWDATSIPAGVYFIRLQSGGVVATKKVVLMR